MDTKGDYPHIKKHLSLTWVACPYIEWACIGFRKKWIFFFKWPNINWFVHANKLKMCQSCNVVLDVSIQYNTCNVEAQGRIWFCLRAYLSMIILCFNHGGYKAVHKSVYPPWYIHICKCCCARFNVLNSGNRSMNLCYWLLFYKTL